MRLKKRPVRKRTLLLRISVCSMERFPLGSKQKNVEPDFLGLCFCLEDHVGRDVYAQGSAAKSFVKREKPAGPDRNVEEPSPFSDLGLF